MSISDLSADILCLISKYNDNPLVYPLNCLSTIIQNNIYVRYNIESLKLGIDFMNKPIISPLIGESDKTIKSFVKLINEIIKKYPYRNNKYINKVCIKIYFNQQITDKNSDIIINLLTHKKIQIKGKKHEFKMLLFNDYLSKLTHLDKNILSYLIINSNKYITNFNIIKLLTHINSLTISYNSLCDDISNLNKLKNLTYLTLNKTHAFGNINCLSELKLLTNLYLSHTRVFGNIKSLGKLVNLIALDLSNTQVEGDISDLCELYNLTYLSLELTDVTGNLFSLNKLNKLNKLNELYLRHTNIKVNKNVIKKNIPKCYLIM